MEIIPPQLAVKAMRDNGYRNTAYALAELIDNSVQADASALTVFCIEIRQRVSDRERRRMSEIAILDNGKGMHPDQLRMALQFGNGTHLDDRTGIGRFGMGLPNSSISQCRRLDVWSWQNGPDNAMHSYLDVDAIEVGAQTVVPAPNHDPLPEVWRSRAHDDVGTTGTLVVWSKFDEHRLTWRTAKSTLEHAETLVGRMYRKFISKGTLNIRLVALEDDAPTFDRSARVNDPMYLMPDASTPAPFDKEAMFQPWGDGVYVHSVKLGDAKHDVIVRMSWARPETVNQTGADRGSLPYGKHAAKNIGVSIVRADRELDLDQGWTIGYDPMERWWGVEVEFPPALDEVFGVPNNKQAANVFSQMAHFDWTLEAEPGEKSIVEVKERLRANNDPRAELMEIADYIKDNLVRVRARLKEQSKGRRSGGKRHEDLSVEDRATNKFKERAKSGHEVEQDKKVFDAEAKDMLVRDLVKKHYPAQNAKEIAEAVQRRGKRVIFVDAELDGYAFFKIDPQPGGVTEVVFNTKHPAYELLVNTLDADVSGATDKELIERIENASDTFKMLFAAWARYEMEDIPNRQKIDDMRQQWGRMARVFLQPEED
jgi:hypothetical protein